MRIVFQPTFKGLANVPKISPVQARGETKPSLGQDQSMHDFDGRMMETIKWQEDY